MDDGKADHPTFIIPPPNSRNDVNSAPTDSTTISISTAVLARQVKIIYDSGDIPIIVGFHNIFVLEKCLKSSPKFDSNITIDGLYKNIFCPDEWCRDKT